MSDPLFFRSKTQKWIKRVVIILCIASLLLEFTINRYSHFADSGFYSIDGIFGFYGIIGFIGCAIVIILMSIIGAFVKVGEGYYNNDF